MSGTIDPTQANLRVSLKESLKQVADTLPYPVARLLSNIPFSFRLGRDYTRFTEEARSGAVGEILRGQQLERLKTLVKFAYNNVPFYRSHYDQAGFEPASLQCFDDICRIPVVTKAHLQRWSLADRSSSKSSLKRSNTGGTSGQPLSFYLEKAAYAREWAHMHQIWAQMGYRTSDLKLTVRGANIGERYVKYRFNQNEFLVNAYSPITANLDVCRRLIRTNIRWLHGYPSSIASFLRELKHADPSLFQELVDKVNGVFLGSEFPAPQHLSFISGYCGLRTLSWYGHSEMCVLAPEQAPGSGVYVPYQSYGYAEAVPTEGAGAQRLIATSTQNFATPFIRYDTGDLIEGNESDGMLRSFRISEGRESDSVLDRDGRCVSLTALIFGRHHRAFDHAEHVQVRELAPGHLEILVTASGPRRDWEDLFDFSFCSFSVQYQQIEAPVRTKAGKVPLLLRSQ